MSFSGPLSSLMLTAGAGLLPSGAVLPGIGPSLDVNSTLSSVISGPDGFNNLNITSQFSNVVTNAASVLSAGTLTSLQTLGSNTFPALTNSVPGGFAASLGLVAPGGTFAGGFTGLISNLATNIMGGGDLTRFAQIYSAAGAFSFQANQFINSGLNISAIGNTFGSGTGGMDNLITGGFNQVTQAFGSFGSDLGNLGNLINLKNLDNLGSPAALIKQLSDVGGVVPSVSTILRDAGLGNPELIALLSGNFGGLTESANKLLYEGMTKITGNDLQQVKNVLKVTTPGITNMAELLDPVKILPNSFPTLTMPTPDGLRGIYVNNQGAVNTNLAQYLSTTLTGLNSINPDLIRRIRTGSSVFGSTNRDLISTSTDTKIINL